MIKKVIEEYKKADGTKRIYMYLYYRDLRRVFDYIETTDCFQHRKKNGVAGIFDKMQQIMPEVVRSGSWNN